MKNSISCAYIIAVTFFMLALSPTHLDASQVLSLSIIKKEVLAIADLKNGQNIFINGQLATGTRLSFTAGPHWLRSQGGGCAVCHGRTGLGDIQPEFCFKITPPITYKYLVGSGYPLISREDGSHPAYTTRSLKATIENGQKPNGADLDYCMPRWRLSHENFRDLLGYILTLSE